MTKIKVGKNFPVSIIFKKGKWEILEDGYFRTDLTCDEVRELVEEEIDPEFRDYQVGLTLVATATALTLVGAYWNTYALVDGHLIPAYFLTLVVSYILTGLYIRHRRRKFLDEIIIGCKGDDE